MKRIVIYLSFFIISIGLVNAQTDVQSLIDDGIEYHDNGQYDLAIQSYLIALELDPTNQAAIYELCLSYLVSGDYESSIEYCDRVIARNDLNVRSAYLNKGTSLEYLGRTEEAIAVYREALEKIGEDYILYYYLAIACYDVNDMDAALDYGVMAVMQKLDYNESHYILGEIMMAKNQPAQATLCFYYYLLLEGNTAYARDGYNYLRSLLTGEAGVDTSDFRMDINLYGNASEFRWIDILMSYLVESWKANEAQDEQLWFQNISTDLFKTFEEQREDDSSGFWWNYYIPLFTELGKTEHMETYCYWARQSVDEDAHAWLQENPEKLQAFADWLKEH